MEKRLLRNFKAAPRFASHCFLLISIFSFLALSRASDYADALSKSLLYFESQRSGRLPHAQRVPWRHHSGLTDGLEQGVDLVGGYYDAGDHVKFGLPMAFTVTMLAWSVVEYSEQLAGAGELKHALDAIKWGTDYFIKAHTSPNVLWAEVGDGDTDHYCWQRPEDMTTSRQAYKIDENNPGSDLAGETAASMAAASIVFRKINPHYSHLLLHHAQQLFEFGDKYRGKYDENVEVVKSYYASVSGYMDELLWGAIWLYKATNKSEYLEYVIDKAHSFGGVGWAITEFSWDVKYAGLQILASKVTTQDGFIIGLQRIPSGMTEELGATPKPAVVLQHGLFADANCWLVLGENSLGFYLANNGFDVWLSNARGTQYSRAHTSLQPTQQEFWDWSWDHLSEYDLTAVVNYVSNQTQQKVHYVGHSLGTLMALGALSSRAPVVSQMRSASLLSPIAHLNHIASPFSVAAANLFFGEIGARSGISEYCPTGQSASQFYAQICKLPGITCADFMTAIAGPSCCLNQSSVSVLLDHGLQSSSMKVLAQLSQDIRTGIIAKYDYGNPVENIAHYGSPFPPLYRMSNIPTDFPLFVSYGATDSLGDIVDVEIYLAEIINHDRAKVVKNFNLGYAHLDFIMANNVVEKIYKPLLSFLESN